MKRIEMDVEGCVSCPWRWPGADYDDWCGHDGAGNGDITFRATDRAWRHPKYIHPECPLPDKIIKAKKHMLRKEKP